MPDQSLMDRPEITSLLFVPRKEDKTPLPEHATDIDVEVAEGIRIGCRLHTQALEAPTLIFFHGNGELATDYDEIGPMYTQNGMNFLAVDYRGYGWSGGSPLTSTLLSDCNILFTTLCAWLNEHHYSGKVLVMGRSLGSACAIDVAVNHSESLSGLIIDSGFAKTLPLAKVLGLDLEAMGVTEEETFDNGGKIAKFDKPTFILHGQHDQLIPIWQAERLHADCGAKSKELQIVPGADHNSLIARAGSLYFQVIKKFVDKATGAALDWRQRRRVFKEQQAGK